MTFWLKCENGTTVKLRDRNWNSKIYAAGEACCDANFLYSKIKDSGLVNSVRTVCKRFDVNSEGRRVRRKQEEEDGNGDSHDYVVFEIELSLSGTEEKAAKYLEGIFQNPATFRLYDVDVLPEQKYFYEKDLFPLAFVEVQVQGDQVTGWRLLDDVKSYEYKTPPLRILKLDITIDNPVPTLQSDLRSISLTPIGYDGEGDDNAPIILGSTPVRSSSTTPSPPSCHSDVLSAARDEAEILLRMMREIERLDPDLIITSNGDSFGLPYLYSKAQKHCVDLSRLNRDSERQHQQNSSSKGGTTYFSYGKILYRPTTQRLFGRLHLDEENTFVYDQCRLQGLFEVSRLCRIPLHTSMRASIGKCLSSLQFYYASKKNILVPWKPTISEDFKTGYDLFVGDRGGLVLEPPPGIHEHVGEIDFASLYPTIIRDYNISAETVNCRCCENGNSRFRVEELGMHICDKRKGIVADSIALPLEKRFEYKSKRDSAESKQLRMIYNERAAALKWVLVCAFGYLSYRNAKFGKIDSHMAVCSLARKTLTEAMHTAEVNGFDVLHGIVDSLWVSKKKATRQDYEELCREIEKMTGFRILIEGIYKWIVFLPSKVDRNNRVANRYFGCFEETNEIKVRGIEYRRHDTPYYFKKCQEDILKELARCDNKAELAWCARTIGTEIYRKYARALESHEVPATQLLIRRRLSRELKDYAKQRQLSVGAALKLAREGLQLKAGQTIAYVITKFNSIGQNRAYPEELIQDYSKYDSERYIELLADCCATVLSPFGISKEFLLQRSEPLI